MDDAERVLTRLQRIEAIRGRTAASATAGGTAGGTAGDGSGAGPLRDILAELQALVPEAEAWARSEGDVRAKAAATKLRGEAEGMR
ncbi:MAG TPA: hypothetical protein VIJ70_04920 [Gaiellaceae bacterium]